MPDIIQEKGRFTLLDNRLKKFFFYQNDIDPLVRYYYFEKFSDNLTLIIKLGYHSVKVYKCILSRDGLISPNLR